MIVDKESLLDEITEQWGGRSRAALYNHYAVADTLAEVALIAWQSLASPPTDDQLVTLGAAGHLAGTRSKQPRTVLRKVIEYAERYHGWAPTESVLRAAGRKVPS